MKTVIQIGVANGNDFVKEFPSFVEGDVPPPPASPPKKSYQRTPLVHIPEEQRLTKEALKAGGVMNSARTGYNSIRIPLTSRSRDDKSESGFSTKSNRSVAETIISRAVSRKGKF